tara:strand:+ start:125 stop:304 length:180 start_codon:yes stop_codon:yes gene_type:complete
MKLSEQPGFGKNDTAVYPKIIKNHEKKGHESLNDLLAVAISQLDSLKNTLELIKTKIED